MRCLIIWILPSIDSIIVRYLGEKKKHTFDYMMCIHIYVLHSLFIRQITVKVYCNRNNVCTNIFGRHYHQIIVMVTLIKISEVLKLDLLFVSFICFELNKENVINMYIFCMINIKFWACTTWCFIDRYF